MTKYPIPDSSNYIALDHGKTGKGEPQVIVTLYDDNHVALDRVTVIAEKGSAELTLVVPGGEDDG